VPRADDLRRRAEAQTEALALGIEHFLDLAVDLPWQTGPAGVRAAVFPREDLLALRKIPTSSVPTR
jgi:hypothetical protein